ncbi:hypothetical protein U1E44_05790 [Arenibacter sp. GZD96]|uniref:hypothetical protein n=1 Tax=Aurantibrevibacter litoralis TaxID=3106030 RepID=UPI002AFE2D9A|nr:hypothetical protein [Arenibacter sp. GZD-96]MEA1785594.1 hypothetical protein [Arenibacter sp. GZD-96]
MQDNENRPGIYISKEINNLKLSDGLKILLAVIAYYETKGNCFAGDEHFSFVLDRSIATIQKRLIELEDLGLIRRTKIYIETKVIKRQITTTLLNYEYKDTRNRVSQLLEIEYHNKETNKELNNRESTLAYDFLKLKCPKRLDPWERKYKPKIENFEKFIADYNDLVVIEKIECHPDDLFKFLTSWAFGWIKNQPKYR